MVTFGDIFFGNILIDINPNGRIHPGGGLAQVIDNGFITILIVLKGPLFIMVECQARKRGFLVGLT